MPGLESGAAAARLPREPPAFESWDLKYIPLVLSLAFAERLSELQLSVNIRFSRWGA